VRDHNQARPEIFAAGNMSTAVRMGDTVQRIAGPWTSTIHRLLRHLHARRIDWVPQPLGITDDDGVAREVLSFVHGAVVNYPMPEWVWTDAVLVDAAARLAALHSASSDFDSAGARWQLRPHTPAEVICHNDFAPYNLVFDESRAIVGVIDWDTASPGPRVWDISYLAYRLVPLGRPDNPDTGGQGELAERWRRLELLCRTYGHDIDPAAVAATAVKRLRELADFTSDRAVAAAPHLASHVRLYRNDADWLSGALQGLQ
jgi:hypothetical protein